MKIANFSLWLGLSIALLASPTIVWADEIVDSNTTSTGAIIDNNTVSSTEPNLVPETPTTTTDNIIPTSTIDTATTIDIFATSTSPTTTTSTDTNTDNGPTDDNQITNQTIPNEEINNAIQKILNYLRTQQSADGKILDGNMTDWAIMSFGTNGQYADEIKNATTSLLDYEKNYNLDDPSDLNSCASYPRHVLALLAAGVSINDATQQGLKQKMLTVCYQNGLYGLNGINDDIFGLIALLALGVNSAEPIIQDIVSTTKSWQIDSGAFAWPDWDPNSTAKIAGDDITGAAANALKYAQTKGVEINNEIFTKAKNYLKSTQQSDGGWGYGTSDVMTTSWVLMGVNALSESQNEWFNSAGKNPWHPLISQLKTDGYYESAWVPGTTDWFAMKHAVPALAGKFWPIILPEKIVHLEIGPNVTYTGSSNYIAPPVVSAITTTTTAIAATATTTTSTADVATTTLDNATNTTMDNNLNNLSIQPTEATSTTSTPELIVKKSIKITPKPAPLKMEVKGEKITNIRTASSSQKAGTTADSLFDNIEKQPKAKKNPILKGLNWILELLKNLI